MEVTINQQLSFLLHSFNHLLGVEDCGVQFFIGVNPLPIEINLCQIAPIVSDNNSVDVEHGDNLEQKILP